MSARDVIANFFPAYYDRTHLFDADFEDADAIIAHLTAAGYVILPAAEIEAIRDKALEEAAAHLAEVAQAMWDRCESKRIPNSSDIGEGEEEDAATAWCFDKAAEAVRALKGEKP